MTTLKRHWFSLAITHLAAFAAVGLYKPVSQRIDSYIEEHDRRLEKLERTAYMLDGTVNPDSERGEGLFTDAEINKIKAGSERLSSSRTE